MKNRVHKKAKRKYKPLPSVPAPTPAKIVPQPVYLEGFFITTADLDALRYNLEKIQVCARNALAAPIRKTTVKVVDKGISSADSYDAMNFVGKGWDE